MTTFTPYGVAGDRRNELLKATPYSHARALMELPGDALVRIYSYQGPEALAAAEARGYWTGSDHIWDEDGEHGFGPPYQWMREQMAKRVPNYSGDYPMWGWVKRPSTKPKVRRFRGLKNDIRITALVPRSRIVFSDYETWHSVLNRGLLCRTEAEWDAHGEEFPHHWTFSPEYRERYLASIEPSWEGCLDFQKTTSQKEIDWIGMSRDFRIQACIDRFYWDEIVSVRHFKGR